MAKYGSNNVTVNFDNSGGTPVDMSNYVDTINEVNVSAKLQESHAMGDSWVEQLFTGVKSMAPITLEGFYDDAASTGPDVVFNAPGNTTTRTLQIVYGAAKSTSVETIITNYVRRVVRGDLTRFAVTLTPTGTVTEA